MAQLGCKLRLCCHIVNSMRELLDIFKLNANRQGRRAAHIDHSDDYMNEDFTGYGEELSSHLEDEGLSYTDRP